MIDLFFNTLRKTMIGITFILFGFFVTYAPILHVEDKPVTVEVAHATWPVVEIGGSLFNTILNTIQTAGSFLLDNVLDGIAWSIAKQFINNMIADTINWINSGFEGRPAFVQNFGDELLRSADQVAGRRINELGGLGSLICEPFRINVQLAFAIEYDKLRAPEQERECTLTGIFDNLTDFAEFTAGDFQRGGWAKWFELTSQPQNTPYGAILEGQAQAGITLRNSQNETVNLANWGSGTLSFKQCDEAGGGAGTSTLCRIVKPGKMISERLNNALGLGENALVEADEINELVGALLGQLGNQVITGARGTLGLGGGTGETYRGYSRGSFLADLQDDDVINNSAGLDGGGGEDPGETTTGVPGIDAALRFMADSVANQETVLDALSGAGGYISRLNAFVNNGRNDEQDLILADIFLDQAEDTRERVEEDLVEAAVIIDRYRNLEIQYADAEAPRQAEIRQEQTLLIQDFGDIGLITDREFESYAAQWDDLLEDNIGPVIIPPDDPCDPRDPLCGDRE